MAQQGRPQVAMVVRPILPTCLRIDRLRNTESAVPLACSWRATNNIHGAVAFFAGSVGATNERLL